jgi:hypothetical protein
MAENGDILLYGCDVGSGERGQSFIDALASATGADVAASDDATGSEELDGDWSLEVQSGLIEVQSISAVSWDHLLAPIAITNLNGTTITASTLADNIAGSGVTVVSASYSGANSQAGTFTSATGYPSEWLAFDSWRDLLKRQYDRCDREQHIYKHVNGHAWCRNRCRLYGYWRRHHFL